MLSLQSEIIKHLPVCPRSGLPVQLDRVLPVLLSDQHHRRTLRSHLRLRPFPHQVDSYRQGMFTVLLVSVLNFDVSMMKYWTCNLCVQFSDYFTGYFNGQYWLWWIFLLLGEFIFFSSCVVLSTQRWRSLFWSGLCFPSAGLLLFFRGFVNYLKVRNMSENMATSHRTRLFFLY